MARLPRLAIAGLPHLVIQRRNRSGPAFVDDVDRRTYLDALQGAARASAVAVHAYVLMNDEVRLLATPGRSEGLSQLMQQIGRRYVAAFHRRHGTRGALWSGRFQATPIDPEQLLLTAMRFIEQAPVKAGLVARAGDWPWSSAPHHTGRGSSRLVSEHPAYWRLGNTPFEREARHERELQQMLSEAECNELTGAARAGWVLGPPVFMAALNATMEDRPLRPKPRGRPRRTATQS